jgi:hypothetical protein
MVLIYRRMKWEDGHDLVEQVAFREVGGATEAYGNT